MYTRTKAETLAHHLTIVEALPTATRMVVSHSIDASILIWNQDITVVEAEADHTRLLAVIITITEVAEAATQFTLDQHQAAQPQCLITNIKVKVAAIVDRHDIEAVDKI